MLSLLHLMPNTTVIIYLSFLRRTARRSGRLISQVNTLGQHLLETIIFRFTTTTSSGFTHASSELDEVLLYNFHNEKIETILYPSSIQVDKVE